MPELPADVRDRAARAAREAVVIVGSPWEIVPEDHKAELYKMVDAVAAAVAEEIERPLQARVELLTAALRDLVAFWDNVNGWAGQDPDAISARIRALAKEED